MKNKHLTDLEIQAYAFDQPEKKALLMEHLQDCTVCQKRVEAYLSLATTIKDQPQPVLDYNLSELVLAQLPTEKSKKPTTDYLISITVFLSISLVLGVLYFYKETFPDLRNATIISQQHFIVSTIFFISIASAIDIISTFKKKRNLLNT
ncbi:MAG: anti-sigma factor [Saprospiraceae bacterium]